MKSRFVFIFIAFHITGCSHAPSRNIAGNDLGNASDPDPLVLPDFNADFTQAAKQIRLSFERLDSNNCKDYLGALEKSIDAIDVQKISKERLVLEADSILTDLFQARLTLHKRISILHSTCLAPIRNTFRIFRFLEDYIAELKTGAENLDPVNIEFKNQKVPILESHAHYLLQTPDQNQKLEFLPGDIVVARGVSFLSAMISRLGDVDSQYSHIVLMSEDPVTQKLETIESYVGEGVKTYALDVALKNENSRLLVLRPHDREQGRRASTLMRAQVNTLKDEGKKIFYDYSLDFNDHKTMSCAEVAQVAYLDASNSQLQIPEFKSKITSGLNLLEHIGIPPGETFSPGDMELDTRFEIVAEWRDLRLTRDSRLKDAVLTSMLKWMDQDHYQLRHSTQEVIGGGPIWLLRKTFLWPLVRKSLKLSDFSKEIPRKMLKTVIIVNQIGDVLLKHLREQDALHQKTTGWPMTYIDLYRSLDAFRIQDLKKYASRKTRKESSFHRWFRGPIR